VIITGKQLRKRSSPVDMSEAKQFVFAWGESKEVDEDVLVWATNNNWPIGLVVDHVYGEGSWKEFVDEINKSAKHLGSGSGYDNFREDLERIGRI